MKRPFLNLLVVSGLILPTMASAQLTITFSPATQTLTPGGSTPFRAVLANTSATLPLTLTGFSLDFHPDLSINDTAIANLIFSPANPSTPTTLGAGQSLPLQDIFTASLASSPSEMGSFLYDQNTITVEYAQNNNPSLATSKFSVQSKTPTPPVILVTLISGIGTARMAMRRRKKA